MPARTLVVNIVSAGCAMPRPTCTRRGCNKGSPVKTGNIEHGQCKWHGPAEPPRGAVVWEESNRYKTVCVIIAIPMHQLRRRISDPESVRIVFPGYTGLAQRRSILPQARCVGSKRPPWREGRPDIRQLRRCYRHPAPADLNIHILVGHRIVLVHTRPGFV